MLEVNCALLSNERLNACEEGEDVKGRGVTLFFRVHLQIDGLAELCVQHHFKVFHLLNPQCNVAMSERQRGEITARTHTLRQPSISELIDVRSSSACLCMSVSKFGEGSAANTKQHYQTSTCAARTCSDLPASAAREWYLCTPASLSSATSVVTSTKHSPMDILSFSSSSAVIPNSSTAVTASLMFSTSVCLCFSSSSSVCT